MSGTQHPENGNPRRHDDNERFVAFAFSAAEMLVETDTKGMTSFVAGAFRTHFGTGCDAYSNRNLRDMFATIDHDNLAEALNQLGDRGRVSPFTVRLANAERTPVALSGIALPAPGRPTRFCLSIARLPALAPSVLREGAGKALSRAATECLAREGGELNLIEILSRSRFAASSSAALGAAFGKLAPGARATELAPGRYGLLTRKGAESPKNIADTLTAALRAEGIEAAVASCRLSLAADGASLEQAARTMRHALTVFARNGPKGFSDAGFDGGIASYMQRAATRAGLLRTAIEAGRFSLLFQPIVTLKDQRFHHAEALIRPHPIPGIDLPGPQDFVTLVESLGLAEELDIAVGAMACEAARRAQRPVAFNLSGQSLQSPSFRNRLADLLEHSLARKAGLMIVELTETAEIEDMTEALRTTAMLRTLGVNFCLDDFGAGSTDVRQLRALSPDIVKLDGSYVPGVAQEGRERAFLAGMAEIARAAGARTVAERIETEAEADALREIGVELGQGWLFGRPGHLAAAPASHPVAAGLVASGQG